MRLIDADALQNILLPITTALEHEYGSIGGAVSGCMKHIDNAPTIDAVPVVRCRECKHFNMQEMECENDAISTDHEGGASYSLNFYLDDFCSYGERKEGVD